MLVLMAENTLQKGKLFSMPIPEIEEAARATLALTPKPKPVCPNCHSVMHLKSPPYAVDE